MPYSKVIIVVDEFVDPFNLEQVMWALTTRVKPSKDVAIIPNCAGMPLDPSSVPAGMHDKLIIDATTPVAPEPNPRSVELLNRLRLPRNGKLFSETLWLHKKINDNLRYKGGRFL